MKVEEIRADYTTLADTGAATSDWHRAKLADIAQVIRGVTYKKEQATSQPATDMLPILRATNVQDGSLVLDSDLVFVPKELVSETQKLRVGDIVVATSSGSKHLVGKTAQVREAWEGSFGAFCAAIRPTGDIDQRYLGYFFETREYKDYISKKALGVNINNLRRGDLEEISVPVAPLDQQKRIVAEIEKQFSRLDEAVASLKRVKANLKRYKAAVLKAAVEGRLVETEAELARREGRSYETGAQLLQRILETRRSQWQGKGKYKEPGAREITDLPELPEGWVWEKLENAVLGIVVGYVGPVKEHIVDESHTRFLSTTHVGENEFIDVEIRYVSDEFDTRNRKSSVAPGDVLIARHGDSGKACLVPHHIPRAQASNVVIVRPNSEITNPVYLMYAINATRRELQKKKVGGVQQVVNTKSMGAFPLPIPPRREQDEIVKQIESRLSVLGALHDALIVAEARAGRLGQSILRAAFSGALASEANIDQKQAV
jgi:type I restriction enzyme S subunit